MTLSVQFPEGHGSSVVKTAEIDFQINQGKLLYTKYSRFMHFGQNDGLEKIPSSPHRIFTCLGA